MVFIVRVPGINSNGKTKGCKNAGLKIIESLREIGSNEKGIPIDTRLFDFEEIHLDNSNLELTHELISKNSLKIFEEKPKTIFLGGDHSISYPLVNSFFKNSEKAGKEPCLMIFDSLSDCLDMKDLKFPSNREWVKELVENGFPPENIFLIGVRDLDLSEISFLNKNKIKVLKMNQILENIDDSCDILMEFSKGREVYISVDIGVLDPAFSPGSTHNIPGGLTSRQLIYFIQRLNKIKTLRAADIVEVNPKKDYKEMTVKLAAKILSELV
ncbi:MAG: arginase family protein [Candidatus Pacearchaeota archaeon]